MNILGTEDRKEREKKQRKALILNAAKRVFLNKGYSGATVEEIANEAELSIGTLYIYFKKV